MASSDNLFGLDQIEVNKKIFDTTRIFEEIHKEMLLMLPVVNFFVKVCVSAPIVVINELLT